MRIKVLHIVDCFLPETMNWIDALLEQSSNRCEHHIAADYLISKTNNKWKFVDAFGMYSTYPIPVLHKVMSVIHFKKKIQILKKYISEHSIEIVHIHFGNMLYKYYPFLQELKLGFCCSLYGYDYEYLPRKNKDIISAYKNFGNNPNAKFVVEGNFSKNVLKNYGIQENSIEIVHMIFDRGKVSAFPKFIQPIHFIQIASFSEKKNQLGFLQHLPKHVGSRISVSMFGEVVDKKYFHEVLRAKENMKYIDITIGDKLDFTNYLGALQGAHFAVNLSKRSSMHDTEGGCPVFIKDALVLGKPVLATTHCDIPEWVFDGYNGWLFPENDLSSLSSTISTILKMSTKEYMTLSRNAKQCFSYHTATNQTSVELIHIYQSLVCG